MIKNHQTNSKKTIYLIISFLLFSLITIIVSAPNSLICQREFSEFIEENEEERQKREDLSKQLIGYSLNNSNTEELTNEYIPQNVDKIMYFADKLNVELYINYPEYSEDANFPYSGTLDPEYIDQYENYYVVYFDNEHRVVREDYYENASLRHFLFNFYKNNKRIRNRVTYIKNTGNLATYDYFNYDKSNYYELSEDSAVVTIRYENQYVVYFKVEYKHKQGHTYISQEYSRILEKDGVWYYYDEDSMLRKKEYWENNKLIKYELHLGFFIIQYYDGRDAPISKEEYKNL